MMLDRNGVDYRINRAFLLQGLLIAFAALLGVYFTKIVIEEILIENAIQEEQDYFWDNYKDNPFFPLPDTKNLSGFFDKDLLPEHIKQALPEQPGYYEYGEDDNGVVLQVSTRDGKKLYLLYYRGQVDRLILYYGLAPLLVVLSILYISMWIVYRYNRRMVSPFLKLARQINSLDLSKPDFSTLAAENNAFDTDNEIKILSAAIISLGERLQKYIDRERDFTRDASHELRSPLTVINMAADMLISEQQLSKQAESSVEKIKRAALDVEKLIEIFLLLAREKDQALTKEKVLIHHLIERELNQAQPMLVGKNIIIKFEPENELEAWAPAIVISVLIGNLIRNAILYTEKGEIRVTISGHLVTISDTGRGIEQQDLESMFEPYQRGDNQGASGYGIGLTIVKRLSDRFNWPVELQSEPGQGTRCTVNFLDSKIT